MNTRQLPMLERLRTAFAGLNERERRMIVIGAALIGITLLWLLNGWQAKTHSTLDTTMPRAAAQLAAMQSESAELARLRGLTAPAAANLTQLEKSLAGSATARGLTLTVRNDGNQLVLRGQGLNFDVWTQWLAETQRNSAIKLTYLDVSQGADGTQIEARLAPL